MTIKTVITPTDLGAGLVVSGAKVVVNPGHGLAISGAQVVAQSLPSAEIMRTSKVGLTATFNAFASTSTEQGNALSYVWSVAPGAGVTISSPTGASTNIVASTPGDYTVTLTITDAYGASASATHKLHLDRYLQVAGANDEVCDRFSTLQAAINWINTNDSANAASYLIEVFGVTSDVARIVPNLARVRFSNGGQLPVGVDFGAGTFYWSGSGKDLIALNAASGAGIAFTVNNTTLYLQNMGVKVVGTGSASALRTGVITGVTLNLQDCYFETTNGACVSIGNGTANIKNCYCNAIVGGQAFAVGTEVLYIDGLEARAGLGFSAVYLADVSGFVSGVRAFGSTNGATVVKVFHINELVADALTLVIKDCLAVLTGATAAAAIACAYMFEGGSSRQVYLVNCTAYALLGWALVRLSSTVTGNWNVINCVLIGANAGAVLSNLNATTVAAAAWNPARIYNTVFRGALNGPITFTAGTSQTGENIIM